MAKGETIIVDQIPTCDYHALIAACVRYAILSLPFTVDRMHLRDIGKRVRNIAKGKIAEALFFYFCKVNGISIDHERCNTPFWQVDKRDFLLNSWEWDIKNNFIYHEGDLPAVDFADLPALIPNRFSGDQWSKRLHTVTPDSEQVAFLFTFLKNARGTSKHDKSFVEICLSDRQAGLLQRAYDKYQGLPQREQPFDEAIFWHAMAKAGETDFYRLLFQPALIITGYATAAHWALFADTGSGTEDAGQVPHASQLWYVKNKRSECVFLDGLLKTRIVNATARTGNLPSFLSLFPHLKEKISCARIV